jgi:galactokinase
MAATDTTRAFDRDDVDLSADALRAALAEIEPAATRSGADVRLVRAPGRVNLIGEHTDYNDGLVLPAAIDREIRIAFVPSDDRTVRLTTLEGGDRQIVDLDAIGPRRGSWIDYVAGIAQSMHEAGLPTRGFSGVLASNLPQEAGLSSSAALELASIWALSAGDEPALPRMDVARVAQRAENRYVGVQSGLMDQFASAFGVAGSALRFDCRSFDWAPVPIPADALTLVVCHSGAPRTLAGSAYNDRRAECGRAVEAIANIVGAVGEIRSLRDVDEVRFEAIEDELTRRDPVAARRARHVVREIARVDATARALEARDLEALGRLFAASHESLRVDYEVSSKPLDTLVAIARETDGVIAARLTGAGFGGCTVNLVRPDAVDGLVAAVERDYEPRTGLRARVFVVAAADGAGPVTVPAADAAR